MLFSYATVIRYGFHRVERALLEGVDGWLPGLVREAGAGVTAELSLQTAVATVARKISLEVGPPVRLAGRTVVPLGWQAAAEPELFPILKGRLEARRLTSTRTELALVADYTPPAGPVGEAADHVVLHRIAEASLKDFLERVAKVVARNAWSQLVGLNPTAIAGPDD
jgi:hypothetical protein